MIVNWNNRKPGAAGLTLNRAHRLARRMVGCWLFNEGGGNTAVNDIASGETGSLQSSPTWVDGNFGRRCLQFGSGAHVRPRLNYRRYDSVGTIAAWIRSTSFTNNQAIFFSGMETGFPLFRFGIVGGGAGNLYCQAFDNAGTNDVIQCTTPLSLNTWYHVVLTSTGSTWGFYINAAAQSLGSLAGGNSGLWISYPSANPDQRCHIGWLNGAFPTQSFDGKIDHLMLWNRVLSASEISELYVNPFAPVATVNPNLFLAATSVVGAGGAPAATHRWFLVQ